MPLIQNLRLEGTRLQSRPLRLEGTALIWATCSSGSLYKDKEGGRVCSYLLALILSVHSFPLWGPSIYRRRAETPASWDWAAARFWDFPFTTSYCCTESFNKFPFIFFKILSKSPFSWTQPEAREQERLTDRAWDGRVRGECLGGSVGIKNNGQKGKNVLESLLFDLTHVYGILSILRN